MIYKHPDTGDVQKLRKRLAIVDIHVSHHSLPIRRIGTVCCKNCRIDIGLVFQDVMKEDPVRQVHQDAK